MCLPPPDQQRIILPANILRTHRKHRQTYIRCFSSLTCCIDGIVNVAVKDKATDKKCDNNWLYWWSSFPWCPKSAVHAIQLSIWTNNHLTVHCTMHCPVVITKGRGLYCAPPIPRQSVWNTQTRRLPTWPRSSHNGCSESVRSLCGIQAKCSDSADCTQQEFICSDWFSVRMDTPN